MSIIENSDTSKVESPLDDEFEDKNYEESRSTSFNLGLGDIIKFLAPNNDNINNKIFYISYIDKNKINFVNSEQSLIIKIDEDGELEEKSIESIELLSKPEFKGYAKQNGLNINTWISIQFDGELPLTINGIITDLENDLIEIKTYPDEEYIYIDFAYKGIPEDLPINSITIIDSPLHEKTQLEEQEQETLLIDDTDIQNISINKEDFERELQDILIPNDLIEFGEELGEIKVLVDVEKSEKRFDIEQQLNDLLDEMLSTIPNSERSSIILNRIHNQINKFDQLRTLYSKMDDGNNYNLKEETTKDFKPLIEEIMNFDKSIKWITPILSNKKIFYEHDDDIPEDDRLYITKNIYSDIENYYNELEKIKSNANIESINKYRLILQNVAEFNRTFINDNNSYFYKAEINNIINFLVNNFDTVMSNTFNKNNFKSYSFYNQVLNSPDSNLERIIENNRKKNIRVYHNYDKALLNSFILNDETVYKYTNMNMKNTNIYEKSNYSYYNKYFISHNNYYKKSFSQQFIDSFSSIIDENQILKSNIFFNLNSELNKIDESLSSKEKNKLSKENFKNLLQTILPSTNYLIDKFKSSKVNLTDYLYDLQPNFSNIYNIESELYTKIIANIKQNIEEYKKILISNKEYFENLTNTKNKKIIDILKSSNSKNSLTTLFKKLGQSIKNDFFKYYNIKNFKLIDDVVTQNKQSKTSSDNTFSNNSKYLYTDEEIYNYTNTVDFNRTLFNSFYENLLELITTNQIEQFLDVKTKNIDDLKKQATETCKRFILAKKYLEFDELENDNNKLIYFDKKLDRTNYKIIEQLKEQRKNMTQQDFNLFLKNKLLEENLIDENNVDREIDSLLKGKREVIDGDYALLINNNKENNYNNLSDNKSDDDLQNSNDKVFIRQNNKWIQDKNVDPNLFFVSNKLFCNLQEKCIENNNSCDTFEEFEKNLENENIKDIVNQSSSGFESNIEETKEIIKQNLINSLEFLERKNNYDKLVMLKYNDILQRIAQSYVENDFELSPYENLKNKILSYPDFVKRQDYIIKFCNLFTREAFSDEDKNWLYCNKTNKKLIPSFFRLLAISYYNGDYVYVLDEIIAERGTISDDGNSWVDKHSGYLIKMIEFDTEEGYNEQGFKLQTRDVVENDYVITQTNIKYTSETSQMIYKVISSISSFMGLNLEAFHDFIINNVFDLLKILPSEEKYKIKQKKTLDESKKALADYKSFYNSSLIINTMVFIIIAIQTSIPSLKTKKTFPGCIKSFSGYPLDGNVDKSSITYIACIVNNIKTNVIPWNSILKTSQNSLIKKMETIIDNIVLKNTNILDLFDKKHEYLKYNKDDIIPDELDLNRWVTFLPPLFEIKISDEALQPVAKEFKNIIFDNIRKGKSSNYYNDILFKINNFSFGIIKSIQNTVKKFTTLLASNNGEPFLENACCNETINTILFFINEDSSIKLFNDNAGLLQEFMKEITTIGRAALLYHPFDTKIKSYEIPNTFNEQTIYQYFIKKCKFDSILPISDDIKAICMSKPSDYKSFDTIDKKIQILKNNGNNYSIESLEELMQIINLKNSFVINYNENIDSIQRLQNTLKSINELIENDESIEKLFNKRIIEKFLEVINKSPGVISEEITDENKNQLIREFKNLLIKDIELNKTKTFDYIKRNANINKKQFDNLTKCLDEFFNFKDNNFQNIQQFFKISIRNLVRVFPNIIINNNNLQESNFIPDYWKLSSKHSEDLFNISNNYYKSLFEFFDNKKLDVILNHFQDKCLLIEKLIKYTNFYEPIKFKKSGMTLFTIFDESLTKLLFENYLYRIFTYLTDLQHDPKLILELNEIDDETNYDDFKLEEDDRLEGGVLKGEIDSKNTGSIDYTSFVEIERSIIENNTAKLIYSFTNILCETKNLINTNYESINKKINYAKDKEKTTIVNFLKELTPEEREIEDILKNSKLERWSVGLQKGLTQYDPNFYDKEREKLESQLLNEVKLQKVDEVSKLNAEIFNYELEYQEKIDNEVEEEYSLSNIPDDNDFELDDSEYANYDGDNYD